MSGLAGSDRLQERFDVALLDLDGVVYRGDSAVDGAAKALAAAREAGMRLAFVTNNALREPADVANKLVGVGVAADPQDVVTSAQAAARVLADRLDPGAHVLVCGGAGLRTAVEQAGLVPVTSTDEQPAAVVNGFDPTLDYPRLAEAALAIRQGALWVASNLDLTVPAERGLLPGAGSFIALLRAATGREPLVAGKPERALHEESVTRTGAARPLVVGDRLDTDIEGGNRADTPTLLVLTGVATLADAARADAIHRPTFLGRDLSALAHVHPSLEIEGTGARCGAWCADVTDGVLRWSRDKDSTGDWDRTRDRDSTGDGDDGLDAARAALAACWAADDAGMPVASVEGQVPSGCEQLADLP